MHHIERIEARRGIDEHDLRARRVGSGWGERSWILSKKKDEYSTESIVTDDETSVKTGKTLVEVATENGTVVNHPEAHGTKPIKSAQTRVAKKTETKTKAAATKQAVKKKARP